MVAFSCIINNSKQYESNYFPTEFSNSYLCEFCSLLTYLGKRPESRKPRKRSQHARVRVTVETSPGVTSPNDLIPETDAVQEEEEEEEVEDEIILAQPGFIEGFIQGLQKRASDESECLLSYR